MSTATLTKPFIDQSKVTLKGIKAFAFIAPVIHMNDLIIVPTVDVPITVLLANGLKPHTVKVPTPCDIFNWQVLRESDKNVVESEPNVICIQPVTEKHLFPMQVIREHDHQVIKLNVDLYEDGQEYIFHCSFWGEKAEAKFKVVKTYMDMNSLFS